MNLENQRILFGWIEVGRLDYPAVNLPLVLRRLVPDLLDCSELAIGEQVGVDGRDRRAAFRAGCITVTSPGCVDGLCDKCQIPIGGYRGTCTAASAAKSDTRRVGLPSNAMKYSPVFPFSSATK